MDEKLQRLGQVKSALRMCVPQIVNINNVIRFKVNKKTF